MSSAKVSVTSAVVVSGSKSSSRMSYGSSTSPKHSTYWLRSSYVRSSIGRKSSKFDSARAFTQIVRASVAVSVISARSSVGTLTAFS